MEYKKNMLDLAKEHREAGKLMKINRYYMPKDEVVSARAAKRILALARSSHCKDSVLYRWLYSLCESVM